MKSLNIYFKFIFPLFMLLLLSREAVVFMATPNEHHLNDVNFFVPDQIETNLQKAQLANMMAPFIANNKFVHSSYRECRATQQRFRFFYPKLYPAQIEKCLSILDRSLKSSPTASLVWLEKAKSHALQKTHNDELNLALTNTWKTGPKQTWVAERRLKFSLDNWLILSKENQLIAENDFLYFSPKNRSFVKLLARQFLLNPDIKDVAPMWIAKAETKIQRQFIGHVRAGK